MRDAGRNRTVKRRDTLPVAKVRSPLRELRPKDQVEQALRCNQQVHPPFYVRAGWRCMRAGENSRGKVQNVVTENTAGGYEVELLSMKRFANPVTARG
jgi:hypothetical protein